MRSRSPKFIALLTFFGAALLTAVSVSAQPRSDLYINLGWFPTQFSSSARLSSNDQAGTDVDLENDLGFNTRTSNIRLEGNWRFKPRHRLEFGYTSWRRSAEKSITQAIDWNDKHFDVGAHVKGANNAQFIKLAYRYSIVRSDTLEFDVSGGFDTVWNKTTLEGEATITGSGGSQVSGFYKDTYNYVAPAPVFGAGIAYQPGQKFVYKGSTEYFQATINDTTAKILDFRASVDYFYSPRWGAGLEYTWVGYKVERSRFDATYDFSGPVLYFSYRR